MAWVLCGNEDFLVEVDEEIAVKPTKAEVVFLDHVVCGGKLAKYVKRINQLLRWQPQARFAVANYKREIAKLTQ